MRPRSAPALLPGDKSRRGRDDADLEILAVMPSTVVNPGLEGIVVGETVLSNVEGEVGRLTYRGYDIHDLAEHANYEEVVHLLLFGHLPTHQQLIDLNAQLAARRALPCGLAAMV